MSFDDAYINIDTPENVAFNYEVAGLGSRFMAALVDSLIIGLAISLLYTIVMLSMRLMMGGGTDIAASFNWGVAFLAIMSFVVLWGYYVIFEAVWNGQTIGKRWVKLQVVRSDGTPITLTESIIRNIVRLVDFLPFSYGIGVIAMFADPQSRRLGDMAAGTLVILDQAQEARQAFQRARAQKVPLRLRNPENVEALPVERLSPEEILLVEEFILRGLALHNQRAVAHQIVTKTFRSMDLPPERIPERRPQ